MGVGLLSQVHEASGLEQPPPALPFLLGGDEGLLSWLPCAGRVLETTEAEEPQKGAAMGLCGWLGDARREGVSSRAPGK